MSTLLVPARGACLLPTTTYCYLLTTYYYLPGGRAPLRGLETAKPHRCKVDRQRRLRLGGKATQISLPAVVVDVRAPAIVAHMEAHATKGAAAAAR